MAGRDAFERALWRARWEAFVRGVRQSWLIWVFAGAGLIAYALLERFAPLHR